MLKRILTRRNVFYLASVLVSAALAYAAAIMHTNRLEAIRAVPEVWYFYELLRTMERGDSQAARVAIAYKADEALQTVAEVDPLLGAEERKFQAKVLKEYRAFRETHPNLYEFPSYMPPENKDEWIRRNRVLSDFLKKY